MAFLTKELIVAVSDSEKEVLDIVEWGGEIRVRSLTGAERQRLRSAADTSPCWDALCCSMGIVDEKGANLFAETEAAVLAKKHPMVLDRIANKILSLSNMTKEARSEMEKKQQQTLTNPGGSSSPDPSTPAMDSTSTLSSETPAAVSSNAG